MSTVAKTTKVTVVRDGKRTLVAAEYALVLDQKVIGTEDKRRFTWAPDTVEAVKKLVDLVDRDINTDLGLKHEGVEKEADDGERITGIGEA